MKKNNFFLLVILLIFSCNKNEPIKVNINFLNNYKSDIKNGKAVFNKACITCHLYGTAGAMQLTDKIAWEELILKKTKEEIFLNVFNGFTGKRGPMPKKGGCNNCSKEDIFDAIEYILSINNLSINK